MEVERDTRVQVTLMFDWINLAVTSGFCSIVGSILCSTTPSFVAQKRIAHLRKEVHHIVMPKKAVRLVKEHTGMAFMSKAVALGNE
jgi:hypothetical protein